jgi:hypothetical protein
VSIYSSKLLLVDNLSKGFDLYELPRSSPSYSFAVPNKKKCVKDGAFAEKASAIVCGTDHGQVYVFSTASSTPMQILRAAGKTVEIQAIGVRHDGIYFPKKAEHQNRRLRHLKLTSLQVVALLRCPKSLYGRSR